MEKFNKEQRDELNYLLTTRPPRRIYNTCY